VQLSFRTKLNLIVASTALALALMLLASALGEVRQARELGDVEGRLVPKLEFGPHLRGDFERLRQSMQDAVAAQDQPALDATRDIERRLLALVETSAPMLGTLNAVALRVVLSDYYASALDVSRRMIRGETGEALVDAMTEMRTRHDEAARLVEQAAHLDRTELARAFEAARSAPQKATRTLLAIGLGCFALTLSLAVWLSRGAFQTLADLSGGFLRFSTEDFSQAIPITTPDELGAVARAANTMAASLQRLGEQRDRALWIQEGVAGLSERLQGVQSPSEAATRALIYLAERLEARAGAIYLSDERAILVLSAEYGLSGGGPIAREFTRGEGLVGECARSNELTVVDNVPADLGRHCRVRWCYSPSRALAGASGWWSSRSSSPARTRPVNCCQR
jgi:methyl-accepting chemotaxis protein